jgi:catechol 2,3-dioxygenase-like lactoylglutathione lyase family enzyme
MHFFPAIQRAALHVRFISALLLCLACAQTMAQAGPRMERIRIATVGAADVAATACLYERWLQHDIVETGRISGALARSWGAPETAGGAYALLRGRSGDDVYLRVVETDVPDDYRALTTWGWNAIEMLVEDPQALHTSLQDSPFRLVGAPAAIGESFPTIIATQYAGPSEELFYFTRDTGPRESSLLAAPRSAVDRPFIMVSAGPDARAMLDFYVDTLGGTEGFFLEMPVPIIAEAQGRDRSSAYPLGFVRLDAFSNGIEVDGYPDSTGPRPTAPGQLPPGVAMASFSVPDLDVFDASLFISTPARHGGLAYGDNRSATLRGPAGELIELIEAPSLQ